VGVKRTDPELRLPGFRPQIIRPSAPAGEVDVRQVKPLRPFKPDPVLPSEADLPDFMSDAAPKRVDVGLQPFGWRPPKK
jgi:hypothetical protein